MSPNAKISLSTTLSMVLVAAAAAQEGPADAHDYSEEMPLAIYQAAILGSANEGALLPSLDYWGVAGAAWGTSAASGTAAAALAPASDGCSIAGQECTATELVQGSVLSAVRYDFARDVQDRAARLDRYRALRAALISKYGVPSLTGRDEDTVRGEDAYVLGIDALYSVGWIGAGTNISLVLTDEQLFVELGATPGVENLGRAADWQAFTEIRDFLPAEHPVNAIIAPAR